jgi:putative ABC transport system permease protein
LGTTQPLGVITDLNANVTLTKGKSVDGTKANNQALISKTMAKKNHLDIGDTFTAYGQTLTVAGIFTSNTEAGNNMVIVSLATLQQLSGNAHAVTEAVATVDSISNITSVTANVKKRLGTSADVTNSKQTVQNAIAPLQSIASISTYSLIGAVAAGSIIVLLTMVMIVRERRREIGIMKAIGFSNLRIMGQFAAEALTFTAMGSVVGFGLGVLGGSPVTHTLVNKSGNSGASGGHMLINNTIQGVTNVQAQIGVAIMAEGIGAVLIIALVGSAVASFFSSHIKPAEVLRNE